MGAVFISGIIFLILTVTRIRQILVIAVPNSLKRAITVGIGLFITIIGFKMSELMVVQTTAIPSTVGTLAAKNGIASLRFFEWNITMKILYPVTEIVTIAAILFLPLCVSELITTTDSHN